MKTLPWALPLLLAAACSPGTEPPGYNGPYPSGDAQSACKALSGRTLSDKGLEWTVGWFAVVPNPVTGKGPVVDLKNGETTRWIPLETDGDVADLHRRVTGSDHPTLKGSTSARYRQAWQ